MSLCDRVRPSRQALHIAVDQTRANVAGVAVLDNAATQRAMAIVARHTVIDENEPGLRPKSASGQSQTSAHDHLPVGSSSFKSRDESRSSRTNRCIDGVLLNFVFTR
jgi:hypothetical protein